jgi:hypothetical protein
MSALLGAGLIVGGTAWGASDPRGGWIDDKGRGGVEIKDCGPNLCGHIVCPSRPNEASAPPTPDAPKVAPEQEPNDYRGRPKVGALLGKLRDLKFGDGYGVRETGAGNCLLKVPHFSMAFKCAD